MTIEIPNSKWFLWWWSIPVTVCCNTIYNLSTNSLLIHKFTNWISKLLNWCVTITNHVNQVWSLKNIVTSCSLYVKVDWISSEINLSWISKLYELAFTIISRHELLIVKLVCRELIFGICRLEDIRSGITLNILLNWLWIEYLLSLKHYKSFLCLLPIK